MIIKKNFLRKNRIGSHGKFKDGKIDIYEFIIECDFCKCIFKKINSEKVIGNKRFCSRNCKGKWIRKYRLTSEIISNGLKNYYSKNNVWNKGKNKETNASLLKNSLKNKEVWKNLDYKKNQLENNPYFNIKGENNPFYGKKHSTKTREIQSRKKSESIANGTYNLKNKRGLKGWYFSEKNNDKFYYDSFWELLRMKILDLNNEVISWTKKHKIRISYFYNEINRTYIPDFLIFYKNKTVLEEIKGYEDIKIKELKFLKLIEYCKKNNFEPNIIMWKELEKLSQFYYNKSIKQLREEFKCQ